MKKLVSILLLAVLAFSLAACGVRAPAPAPAQAEASGPAPKPLSSVQTPAPSATNLFPDAPSASPAQPAVSLPDGADAQISLLFSRFDTLKQDSGNLKWSYVVTDLDRNGQLELLAACIQGDGRFTTARGWEVLPGNSDLREIGITVNQGDSFPDIIINTADTFHERTNDVWYYMFNDQITVSTKEVYANKAGIALKDGVMQFKTFAYQHNEWVNGRMVTTFTNTNGDVITPEDYNAISDNYFVGMDKSSTNFDWFAAAEAGSASRLADSYAVFLGLKQPPKPDVPDTVITPNPDTPSTFLMITKNPTSEYHSEGETAWFIANAQNWTSATWTFVSPDGGEYSWQSFRNRFPACSVNGGDSASLSIGNTDAGMDGWSVYCTFYGNGQTARTGSAYLNVEAQPQPTPTYGQMDGTFASGGMQSYAFDLENGDSVSVSADICSCSDSPTVGDPCTVYFYGDYPTNDSIYHVDIYHSDDPGPVGPVYGQCDGYVSDYYVNNITITLETGNDVTISRNICNISGNLDVGCGATVYYQNYPAEEYIYSCDIYGNDDPPTPTSGQMDGTFASGGTQTFGIDLDNGDSVSISRDICSCMGSPCVGDRCTVYYYGDYPSSDNIYHADIYGRLYDDSGDDSGDDDSGDDNNDYYIHPVVYDPGAQGGWAGANYDAGDNGLGSWFFG